MTPEELREGARKLFTDPSKQQKEDAKSIFDGILKALDGENGDFGGIEQLATLLTLPEDQFNILSPIYLAEAERTFNNTNDKIALAQALNASGIRYEEVTSTYDELITSIDKEMEGILSQQKRDFLKGLLGITYNALADTEGITKRTIIVPIEVMSKDAKLPAYAHLTDAGLDVYATEDITIAPGETKLLKTGLKVALPIGYELQMRSKSGLALSTGLRVANSPGTIDSGYRDEIGVIIQNTNPPIRSCEVDENGVMRAPVFGEGYTISKGQKIAQMVLSEVPKVMWSQVETINEFPSDRHGGFGSTGLF